MTKTSVGGPIIAGVDEAGRGPLAGPVFAAAVILGGDNLIDGLNDSKKLSEKQRAALFVTIKQRAKCWAIASASVEEIDRLNILQASLLAMGRAVSQLTLQPTHALIDGNQSPRLAMSLTTVIKGDEKIPEISAASILAKVARDAFMLQLDAQFPLYGFAKHKGYPTPQHLAALQSYGISSVHRRSFAPVRDCQKTLGEIA